MSWILGFEELRATSTAESGGKGSSLAKLVSAGFPVPPGLIIRSEAYRAFVEGDRALEQLVRGLNWDDPGALRTGCESIRAHLSTRPFPDELTDELARPLGELLDRGPVAVRSSSTMEDLAGAAFAGQHDTILHLSDTVAVLDAVRRCWASLWEDRAARYRHEKGFAHSRAAMAVVIQSMVRSEIAGVVFTIDPITGDLGRVVINASWGLGETVVSGEGDVDQWVVAKESGDVIERSIADKTHEIVGVPNGTERVAVDESRRELPSLDDAQISKLVNLARRVESYYGFPQDLEWAFDGDELYLLQSRPVTRFPARWTRAESAERFPGPITPLTWDFVRDGFHASLEYSLALMGLPAFEGHWFDRHGGYIYGNETAVRLFTSTSGLGFSSLDELRSLVPRIRSHYEWAVRLPIEWARDLDRYLIRLGRFESVDVGALSMEDLWSHVVRIDEAGREYFLPNIAISLTHGLLHRLLFQFLRVLSPERAEVLYDGLTCYCETKTSAVNRELQELAALIRGNDDLRTLLETRNRQIIWEDGDLDRFGDFARRFRRFLEDHGHREVEFDAYHPTWSGQPWVVLENLRLMVQAEQDASSVEREIDLRDRQHRAESELAELVPEDLRYVAMELVRLARVYTSLDDLEHYETTRLWVPFRRALIEIGSRFVRLGVLEEPENVYFLHRKTLENLIDRRISGELAASEARENRDAYEKAAETAPPFVWGQEPEDFVEGDLQGLPGSPGRVTGEVFIVRSIADFGEFPDGAILVARTTNPAWTPLFHSAAGVITESGGPLSHGAVTAREIGIPAVMGVRSAMSRLRSGDRVTVDGTRGMVVAEEPGG